MLHCNKFNIIKLWCIPSQQQGSHHDEQSQCLLHQILVLSGQQTRRHNQHNVSLSAAHMASKPVGQLAWSGCMADHGERTFSNFSLTGLGLSAVTAATISLPTRKASSLVAPFTNTKRLCDEI